MACLRPGHIVNWWPKQDSTWGSPDLQLSHWVTLTPAQKCLVMTALVDRARKIAGKDHSNEELGFFKNIFIQNGKVIEEVLKQQRRGTHCNLSMKGKEL